MSWVLLSLFPPAVKSLEQSNCAAPGTLWGRVACSALEEGQEQDWREQACSGAAQSWENLEGTGNKNNITILNILMENQ